MLTRVQLARYDNGLYTSAIDLDTERPPGGGGYILEDIEGAGPVKSIISNSSYAAVSGGIVHSTRTDMRNILLTVEIEPNYETNTTVEELRQNLYLHSMTGTFVRLRFFKDDVYINRIDGWVEAVEPVIFSKTPQIKISILCPRPHLIARSQVTQSNRPDTTINFTYPGNVEWGMEVNIMPQRTMAWLEISRISDDPAQESQVLRVEGPFDPSQYIFVRTTPGEKQVTVRAVSNNAIIRRLVGLAEAGSSGWPMIQPGLNRLLVRGPQRGDLLWDHLINARYGGV